MGKRRRKDYLSQNNPFVVPRTTLFNRRQEARNVVLGFSALSDDAHAGTSSNVQSPLSAHPDAADTSERAEQEALENMPSDSSSDSFTDSSSFSVDATGEGGGGEPASPFEDPLAEDTENSGNSRDTNKESVVSYSDSVEDQEDDDTPLFCFEDNTPASKWPREDSLPRTSDPDFEEGAYIPFEDSTLPGSPTTVATAIVLITAFIIAHGMSWSGLDDLLKLINVLFGSTVLPHTKYLFRKLWAKTKEDLVLYNYYCESCSALLSSALKCEVCDTTFELADLRSKGSFFVMLKIRDQLQHLVSMNKKELHENLLKLRTATSDNVSDITSGAAYQRLKKDKILSSGDLTVTFNTDGSPLFKSSKSSIWPIQFTLNELPPHVRLQNSTLAGLWFGKKHPNMSIFLKTFVDQFEFMEPIAWCYDTTTYLSKVYAICCCVDAPARAAVQNYMQFNSFFGCPWCLSPATMVERSMRYLSPTVGQERTPEEVIDNMHLALELGVDINGVKGPSPLINLSAFNIVWGYTVDYMHCVLQGVTRQMAECWFAHSSRGSTDGFYIGSPRPLGMVNRRLLTIRPPHCFTRLPRTIAERSFWKASEWRLWLLFYGLPCTQDLLPHRYWKHFSKLSEAVYILLGTVLTSSRMNHAERLLQQFVTSAARLYGDSFMRFNVHQLLHLPKAAREMGPLWAHSTFVFEGGNGKLLKLVTAAKGIPLQIVERVVVSQELDLFLELKPLPEDAKDFAKRMLGEKRLQKTNYVGEVCLLGTPKLISLSAVEREATVMYFGSCPESGREYQRLVYKKQVYHSKSYNRAKKSDSTAICTTDGDYFIINKIVTICIEGSTRCIMLCKKVVTMVEDRFPPHINECFLSALDILSIVVANDIKGPALLMSFEFDDATFVCELPNDIERD